MTDDMLPDDRLPIQDGPAPILTDMSDVTPVEHRFDRIVGNQLLCSLHDTCVGTFIKPTEVLEEVNGELVLVDKA